MYYPIFRGRQNELLAIRELINANLLSDKIIPIIEPVTYSATFSNFLSFIAEQKNRKVGIVLNPINGDFVEDLNKANVMDEYNEIFRDLDNVLPSFILKKISSNEVIERSKKYQRTKLYVYNNSETNKIEKFITKVEEERINAIFLLRFSRLSQITKQRKIILSDLFLENIRQKQNLDYVEGQSYVLNEDIEYYNDLGFEGFADYSIIGDEFSETGFLPKAVVIHVVYYEKGRGILIRHFKSNSNLDNKDPAKKFGEAVEKLVKWNNEDGSKKIDTLAMRKFEELYNNQQYPGLGVIKKLSIMNHLEVVSRVLDDENCK